MERVAVIGLGYVGLPLAIAASERGFEVTGFDINEKRIEQLKSEAHSGTTSRGSKLGDLRERHLTLTSNRADVADQDTYVICVPTPLSADGAPDLSYVEAATKTVAASISRSALVVLESTSFPGTTEEVVKTLLEAHGLSLDQDFFLGFSPERIDPGNANYSIENTPRIIAGSSPKSQELLQHFYSAIAPSLVELNGTREAEMAKLLENTYRHVNIALVNELAIISRDLGIDFREVIRGAASKPFGFQPFFPGPGVGGHCIPIDPNYLEALVQRQLGKSIEFVRLAQAVNSSMPEYVANRIIEVLRGHEECSKGNGESILLLGATYKPNVADTRESPTPVILSLLEKQGLIADFYDPLVSEISLEDGTKQNSIRSLVPEIANYSLVVALQLHDSIRWSDVISKSRHLLDCTGRLDVDFQHSL